MPVRSIQMMVSYCSREHKPSVITSWWGGWVGPWYGLPEKHPVSTCLWVRSISYNNMTYLQVAQSRTQKRARQSSLSSQVSPAMKGRWWNRVLTFFPSFQNLNCGFKEPTHQFSSWYPPAQHCLWAQATYLKDVSSRPPNKVWWLSHFRISLVLVLRFSKPNNIRRILPKTVLNHFHFPCL